MKNSMVIGLALIISSLIIAHADLYSVEQSSNIITRQGETVRLGEVYGEKVFVQYNVKFSGQSKPSINIRGSAAEINGLVRNEMVEVLRETSNEKIRRVNLKTSQLDQGCSSYYVRQCIVQL